MKRFLTAITALFVSTAFICSQAADKNEKENFKGYWNLSVKGGIGHTLGEASFSELLSPAASLGFGYRFTPVWGIRADFSGWQAKGATVAPYYIYRFNYLQAAVDVTVDICSIFAGYNPTRTLNPYIAAGVGLNTRFGNDDIKQVMNQYEFKNYWSGTKPSPAGHAGIGVDIRLNDVVDINVEVNTSILNDNYNSKKGSLVDCQSNALVGLKFNFGRAKGANGSNSAASEAAMASAAAAASAAALAAAQEAEAEAAKKAAEEAARKAAEEKAAAEKAAAEKAAKAAKQAVASKEADVFFKIGSWTISPAEAAKVAELADYMKKNPTLKVTITGHADKETGTGARNLYLSEQRSLAVCQMLKKEGISADRIIVDFKGDAAAPYKGAEKNRVAICIAAE